MEKAYESKYHVMEENYWWFISRRDMILRLIKKLNLRKDSKILEIGCSGGPLISLLERNGFTNVHGIDISPSAIDLCRKRGIKNAEIMDGAKTRFKDNEFELVIASDILEHIENDVSALSEWHRLLKPNGRLIIFVPVFNFLWSAHDEINRHYRRYSKSSLLLKLKKAYFKIGRNSYWNFTLFFPTGLSRILQRLSPKKAGEAKDQLYEVNPRINRLFSAMLNAENRILSFVNFPVGISVFAVCGK